MSVRGMRRRREAMRSRGRSLAGHAGFRGGERGGGDRCSGADPLLFRSREAPRRTRCARGRPAIVCSCRSFQLACRHGWAAWRAVPCAAGTLAFEGAIELSGRLLGYRGKIWTTWYHRPVPLNTLIIGYMRKTLSAKNSRHTYPVGALTGFAPQGLTPPEGVSHCRTADGSWNNLADPKEGAALTRFSRNIGHAAIRAEADASLMSPNPRVISRILLTRQGEMKTVPFLNMLAVPWIQFQSHDWISHGEAVRDDPLQIPLAEDDPIRLRFAQASIAVGRTQPIRHDPDRESTPVTFINEVTHWWDGSQIYGSDQSTVDRLRSGIDGKLVDPGRPVAQAHGARQDRDLLQDRRCRRRNGRHAVRVRSRLVKPLLLGQGFRPGLDEGRAPRAARAPTDPGAAAHVPRAAESDGQPSQPQARARSA